MKYEWLPEFIFLLSLTAAVVLSMLYMKYGLPWYYCWQYTVCL